MPTPAASRPRAGDLECRLRQSAGISRRSRTTVGARLIIRTTRDLALTETGRNYLESCRRILAELDAARLRVMGEQDEPQGELAITAPVAFGRLHVLPIVTAFLKTSPRVAVRLLLIDRVVDLLEEGIDISLRVGSLPEFVVAGGTRSAPSGR